jgi:hypothetical protein
MSPAETDRWTEGSAVNATIQLAAIRPRPPDARRHVTRSDKPAEANHSGDRVRGSAGLPIHITISAATRR